MKIVKLLKTTLLAPFSASDTTLTVAKFQDHKGNEVALSDFGSFGVVVLKQGDIVEIVKFSGVAQSGTNTSCVLTVASSGRNLNSTSPYAGSATGKDFNSGAEVIVTNDPLTLSRFGNLDVAATWEAIQTFSVLPRTTAGNPVDDNDLVRKSYVDGVVAGSYPANRIVVSGTAGETLVAGNLIYLKTSDGRWWKTDADTAATVDNVLLGIAQGAGVAAAAITSGVLIRGYDNNQTGLTANTIYYASNTAGGISLSVGTTEVTVGFSLSTTELYFSPGFNQQITEDQQDALVGTGGTPSAANKFITQEDTGGILSPTGMVSPYAGFTAPTGWLLADGSAVSRTTYATLLAVLVPSLGAATMTIASPAVVTLVAHGLVLDDIIHFTTTGALPTGVTANTLYYVITAGLTANDFRISATKGGAAINSSGSQSGVHTLKRSPYGVGDGSTTFNVPNLKGSVPVGRDSAQTEFNAVGETGGAKTHTLTAAELAAHTHDNSIYAAASPQGPSSGFQSGNTMSSVTYGLASGGLTGGGNGAHNNLQPYVSLNYIIKT